MAQAKAVAHAKAVASAQAVAEQAKVDAAWARHAQAVADAKAAKVRAHRRAVAQAKSARRAKVAAGRPLVWVNGHAEAPSAAHPYQGYVPPPGDPSYPQPNCGGAHAVPGVWDDVTFTCHQTW